MYQIWSANLLLSIALTLSERRSAYAEQRLQRLFVLQYAKSYQNLGFSV